jgi:hypothetical protein
MDQILIGMFGTLFGFLVGEVSARVREAQQERKQGQAVRALLRLEIALNLRLLRDLWTKINPNDTKPEDDSTKRYFAGELASTAQIGFSRDAYHSQMPLLAGALSEAQTVQVFAFYERLNRLAAIRDLLVTAQDQQKASAQAAGLPQPGKPPPITNMVFNNRAPAAWDEFDQLIRQALQGGNPLEMHLQTHK